MSNDRVQGGPRTLDGLRGPVGVTSMTGDKYHTIASYLRWKGWKEDADSRLWRHPDHAGQHNLRAAILVEAKLSPPIEKNPASP